MKYKHKLHWSTWFFFYYRFFLKEFLWFPACYDKKINYCISNALYFQVKMTIQIVKIVHFSVPFIFFLFNWIIFSLFFLMILCYLAYLMMTQFVVDQFIMWQWNFFGCRSCITFLSRLVSIFPYSIFFLY